MDNATKLLARKLPKDVRSVIEDLQAELETVTADRDELEKLHRSCDSRNSEEAFDVLRAVRDWFHQVMFLNEPMRDPRKMLDQVERALEGE